MEEIKINPLAEIKSVKIQGNGYLLNRTMSVPKADGNREYEAIKEWLKIDGNVPEPEFTAEEIAEREAATAEEQAKAERATAMLNGAPYTLDGIDYQISFTKDDGDGLVQVKSAFELGLTSTTIHFDNGTKMPITSAEFGAFAAWFVQKRNEFFV